jgi:hypothetical protein
VARPSDRGCHRLRVFARCPPCSILVHVEPVGRLSCNASCSWNGTGSDAEVPLVPGSGQRQHRDLQSRSGDDNDIECGDIASMLRHAGQRKYHAKRDTSTLRLPAHPPDPGPVLDQWWRLLRLEVGRLIWVQTVPASYAEMAVCQSLILPSPSTGNPGMWSGSLALREPSVSPRFSYA